MSIKVRVGGNVSALFNELSKRWPAFKYGILAEVGYQGRNALYDNYLQGLVINLPNKLDKVGRRTVSYMFLRNLSGVKVSSYPLNLFNPRQVYRSAESVVMDRVNSSVKDYDERVLQKRIVALDNYARSGGLK